MKKPHKYTVICDKTGQVVSEQNHFPLLHFLQTWEATANPKVRELKQTRTAYIDTRYDAKLRLFNYITYTKRGLEIPTYTPYKDTEIGRSIPILNF